MGYDLNGTLNPFVDPKANVESRDTEKNLQRLKQNKPQGSVFINTATSYSGVDIKVVVHVYDNGKANAERIDQLQSDLNQYDEILDLATNSPNVVPKTNIDEIKQSILLCNEEIDRLSHMTTGFSTKVLAEIQTLSVSTHREKFPVRGLGSVYPKSFTRGPRTIAGSMIFTVFDRHVLEEFLTAHPSDFDAHNSSTTALIDQLPPFDITVVFANELGSVSRMVIYGCEFVNEGQTMSIEDLLLENVVQYVARDVDPMRAVAARTIDENNRLTEDWHSTTGSKLLNDPKYAEYKAQLDPYMSFKNRRNPFK